jgi:hypothetical protein
MADKRISQLIERTDIANNDVLPIVASGATTTNKVTISTIQDWMQENLDVGVTSVGLSMPSAFTVTNSPVTASGNIAVAGAGTTAQYIRGDGSLADFPSSTGGGSSVSYYLNGSVNQGTIGGVAYRELSKEPIFGAGTDITINANGYVASFITDAGDPNLLLIPAGNWNFETYFSASSGGGSPTFYIELYKVSGSTSTLIASNSNAPELIAFGTNLNPYFSALAVPATTLALTDRLALRYYVTTSGRTITLHTENDHLCQIITTFTTGLTALNGLTAQVQNFATGTSGTDFNISSSGTTHTFNIPSASATARGLVTTGTQTIQGTKTFITSNYTTFTNNDFFQVEFSNGSSKLNLGSASNIGHIASNGDLRFNTNYPTDALGSPKLTIASNGQATFSVDSVINGVNVGKGGGSISSNTRLGVNSIQLNTTGTANTGIGNFTLQNNTTGSGNTAIGSASMQLNTTGGSNTAVGLVALTNNTTGNANTATGAYALENNTTGSDNTAFGQSALENNTTATGNTAVGLSALQSNTTGTSNTATGRNALKFNTAGNSNTAFGSDALFTNTVSGANTAVGHQSLHFNTGGENTAVGFLSLYENTTGQNNTALGESALLRNTTGSNNIGIGNDAGSVTPSGQNTTGSNSIFIGSDTRALANNQTNQIVIGHNAIGGGSNTVVIGNDSITSNQFKGNLETSRSSDFIRLSPNNGTANLIQGSGSVPLHILTSNSLGLGVGSTPQVTIASDGQATFTGNVTSNGTLTSRTLTNTEPNLLLSRNNADNGFGVIRILDGGTISFENGATGATQTSRLSLDGTTGAATFTGALNGTTASFSDTISISKPTSVSLNVTTTASLGFGSIFLANGDGTTSGKFSYVSYYNAQSVPQEWRAGLIGSNDFYIRNNTAGRNDLVVTTGGNVGIGNTNPFNGATSLRGIALSDRAALFQLNVNNHTYLTSNLYYDGTDWRRIVASGGSFLQLSDASGGELKVFGTASGAAGSAASMVKRLEINSSGSVIVGESYMSYPVSIEAQSGGGQLALTRSGAVAEFYMGGTTGGGTQLFVRSGGSGGVRLDAGSTGWVSASDIRLKDIEKPIENAVESLSTLQTVYYSWKDSEDKSLHLGLIAQEVEDVFPEIVSESSIDEMKGVNYTELIPVLIKAIQELKAEIDSLKNQMQ